jgi:glycine dehydrogenase subunit 1
VLPRPAADVIGALSDHGIAAGFPVGRYYPDLDQVLLLAFTEKRTKEEMDVLASRLEAALSH